MLRQLSTELGEESGGRWEAYPRPQLVRRDWQNLNGLWSLRIGGGPEQSIRVPFCPESALSGIGKRVKPGEVLRYRRSFRLELPLEKRRVLLHFGAVDQNAELRLNGKVLGYHEGGYLPFSFDITEALRTDGGANELTVIAEDPLSHEQPWGKQKEKRGGMWYTPVSGIWQTVWLESVPREYIRRLELKTGRSWALIRTEGLTEGRLTLELPDGGRKEYRLRNGELRLELKPEEIRLWSPEDPWLYYFTLKAGEDELRSYFALRTLGMAVIRGKKRLLLNGKPYFFHGLLDQGYWPDGLYTAPGPEAYEKDILSMKSLGFNTLRKHIKVEPEQFYYDCDRLGMIVFQDMVNVGDYRFLRDTVLPTLGLQRLPDRKWGSNSREAESFLRHMAGTVRHLKNHPCICLWTVFNEGWGQFEADRAYELLRELDSSRFIDSSSGWFHQTKSDVDSRHIYFRKLKPGKEDRPQLLSEFGGYVYRLPEHSADPDRTYGYRICRTREAFLKDLRSLYEDQLLPLAEQGLCGAVYTQLSDVEDETNGLYTYDRKVLKLEPEEFADLAERLQEAVRR